jgi:hypothetical protein
MGKSANSLFIDGAFNYIKNSADTITYTLCSTQPTTRTEAVTTYMLASTTLNKASEITLANGDTSGRKMTISAKSGVSVTNTGTGQHVAICDATNLLFVTTTTSQAVSAGGTCDIGSWKDEIAAVV